MAVGKGSMERAAKAMETNKEVQEVEAKKASVKDDTKRTKKTRKSVTVPSKQVMDKIVAQTGTDGSKKDGISNGKYQVGQEMPIYYL